MKIDDLKGRFRRLAGIDKKGGDSFEDKTTREDYYTIKETSNIRAKEKKFISEKPQRHFPVKERKVVAKNNKSLLNEEIDAFYATENSKLKKQDAPIDKENLPDHLRAAASITKRLGSRDEQKDPRVQANALQRIINEQKQMMASGKFSYGKPPVDLNEAAVAAPPVQQQQQQMQQLPPGTTQEAPAGAEGGQEEEEQQPLPPEEPQEEEQPETPQEPEKKPASKNQLIGNIVKAVERLPSYIDWNEDAEGKIKSLAAKVKNKLTSEDPAKSAISALAIILGATDKVGDENLQKVIGTNYLQFILNNEGIKGFIDNVLAGKEGEVPEGVGQQQEEQPAPEEEEAPPAEEAPPVEEPEVPAEEEPAPAETPEDAGTAPAPATSPAPQKVFKGPKG